MTGPATVTQHIVRLEGCRTEPLGSYLKALGVLRLVAEQADAGAVGWWEDDTFILRSALDKEGLVAFFLDDFRPTPIVTPWNNGSGFGPNDAEKSKAAVAAVEAMASRSEDRFAGYRDVIRTTQSLVKSEAWQEASKAKEAKQQQVTICRNEFPDEALPWIDAAVVLTDEREFYPPLLGTGGNVGRLDFSKMYLEQLGTVLPSDPSAREATTRWLQASLDQVAAPLLEVKIGQFDPGGVGGANSGPFGDAGSLANPWDFVLLIEGAVLFAAGVARRQGSRGGGRASIPFWVDLTPEGFSTATAAESNKGEIWVPVWQQPTGLGELARLVTEGRADWRGRQARSGLDFARSVASLGVDRGVAGFVRHILVERHGQNILAVPAGRVVAKERGGVSLLRQLDAWIDRTRMLPNPSAAVAGALRRVDRAQYALATHGSPTRLQDALIAVAQLELAVARSSDARDSVTQPLGARRKPGELSASQWLPEMDDGSLELRLACALASGVDRMPDRLSRQWEHSGLATCYLRPIKLDGQWNTEWLLGPQRVAGWGERPLSVVLAEFLVQRAIDVVQRGEFEFVPGAEEGGSERQQKEAAIRAEDPGQRGVNLGFDFARPARIAHVAALLNGDVDEERLGQLLPAVALLDWRGKGRYRWPSSADPQGPLVPALTVLTPIFQRERTGGDQRPLRPSRRWPRMLVAGKTETVLGEALQRYRVAGYKPVFRRPEALAAGVDPVRLAAGLMFPLSRQSVTDALRSVDPTAQDQHEE